MTNIPIPPYKDRSLLSPTKLFRWPKYLVKKTGQQFKIIIKNVMI